MLCASLAVSCARTDRPPERALEVPHAVEVPHVAIDAGPGAVRDRLAAFRIGEDNWAQRTVYTWTTREQVDAMRASRVLLVATSTTRGPPSPFVFLIDALSRAEGPSRPLAKVLATDERFTKRRYAWTAAYATVLGLATHRYGNELVGVRLRADAWIAHLDPSRTPAMRVRDLGQREISIADAVAHVERIAAVYHVRSGRDVPVPFREYVLVNEAGIDRWAVGTPDLHAEIAAEAALLRDLRVELEGDAGALAPLWKSTTAFDNERYRKLDRPHLDAIGAGLADYDTTQPELVVTPDPK